MRLSNILDNIIKIGFLACADVSIFNKLSKSAIKDEQLPMAYFIISK